MNEKKVRNLHYKYSNSIQTEVWTIGIHIDGRHTRKNRSTQQRHGEIDLHCPTLSTADVSVCAGMGYTIRIHLNKLSLMSDPRLRRYLIFDDSRFIFIFCIILRLKYSTILILKPVDLVEFTLGTKNKNLNQLKILNYKKKLS